MKKLRIFFSALALTASAWLMPAMAQDFVGKWNTVIKADMMGDMKSEMTISKDEEGNYKIDMGQMAVTKGIYVNKNVMTVDVTAMGMDFQINLTLNDDDTITSLIEVAGMSLPLTATRVKDEPAAEETKPAQ